MGYILTQSSVITCPHGGQVKHSPVSLDVPYLFGYPVCLRDDNYDISGCPLSKHQCVKLKWFSCSPTLFVNSIPVVTHVSVGICYDFSSVGAFSPIIQSHQTIQKDESD